MSHPNAHEQRSVRITGAATVAQAAGIRDQLAAAALASPEIEVEVEASEIDVTLIQLLVAARRSMQERGGSLRLAHPPSGALLETLTRGGFIHHAQEDALWNDEVSR